MRPEKKATSTKTAVPVVTIVMSDDIRALFAEMPIAGAGGFQRLCRMVSERVRTSGSMLRFSPEEFERITHYATHYGKGTYQRRLMVLISHWAAQNVKTIYS